MVNFPKMSYFHGKFSKHGSFSRFLKTVILPWHQCKKYLCIYGIFFPHALDKTTHPALGKFPTKGEISLTMTNSVVDPEFHKGNLKYRGKWLRA
jgi:hypothetical protein